METMRAIHYCLMPETDIKMLEKQIMIAAKSGYTHVIIEFWGTYKFKCFKELAWRHYSYGKKRISKLMALIRSLGMEIIPMFNMHGHAAGCPESSGKHVVLDNNPDLAGLFTSHGWEWNIENKQTLDLLEKVADELIELCGDGKYFHIGCDEAYMFWQQKDAASKFCGYVNCIADKMRKRGRRIMIWADTLLDKSDFADEKYPYYAYSGSKEISLETLKNLDKDIVIADWQYNVLDGEWKSAKLLQKAGFDVLCCCWYREKNAVSAVKTVKNNKMFGIMQTTWNEPAASLRTSVYTGLAFSSEREVSVKEARFIAASFAREVMPSGGKYEKAGWKKLCEFK